MDLVLDVERARDRRYLGGRYQSELVFQRACEDDVNVKILLMLQATYGLDDVNVVLMWPEDRRIRAMPGRLNTMLDARA